MRNKYKYALLALLVCCNLFAGCSSHRPSNVYGTNQENISPYVSENNNDEEVITDAEKLSFSETMLAEELVNNGYSEFYNNKTELYEYASPSNYCVYEMGKTSEQAVNVWLRIKTGAYYRVTADEKLKSEYADAIRILINLEGDEFDETKAIEFIESGEQLNGFDYQLSNNISAYSQIYGNEIYICIRRNRVKQSAE